MISLFEILLGAFWLHLGLREWRKARPEVALAAPPPLPPEPGALPIAKRAAPRLPVAVVIPARNEAHAIADCVRGVLAQDVPAQEIVVVDDRSTDDTGAIALRAAAGATNLRVVPGEPPPPGWLGKPAAVVRGYRHTSADWLAFVDADVRLAPTCLRAALWYARERQLDLVSLAAYQDAEPGAERLIQPWVYGVLDALLPSWEVAADPAGPLALANGQFILIRRAAYERAGTHAAVANRVIDDVALAQAARRVGARGAFVPAPSLLRTRMYRGLGEIRAGWTRTLAQAAAGGSLRRAFALALLVLGVSVLPFALLLGGGGGPGAAVCAVICAVDATLRARKRAWPAYAILHPVGATVFAYLLCRSAWREHRRKPIVWKDRDIFIA